MAGSTGPYSRSQLCRKYGITDRTLRALEDRGTLVLTWYPRNGLMVTDLESNDQKRILAMARNHVMSFGRAQGIPRLPFLRFLFLRFIQVPVEDLYAELLDRNMIAARSFKLPQLKKMHKAFVEAVPRPLQKKVRAHAEASTATEKKQLDVLLKVCGIYEAYHNPQQEQSFKYLSDPEIKLGIDMGLSSRAKLPEIADFIADVAGFSINLEALLFYHVLYHDISFLDNDEIQAYLKGLKPSHRDLLGKAVGSTIPELRMALGFVEDMSIEDTVVQLRNAVLTKTSATLLAPGSQENTREFSALLRNFAYLVDRSNIEGTGKGGAAASMPDVFSQFEMKISQMDGAGLFRLPSAEGEELNHG